VAALRVGYTSVTQEMINRIRSEIARTGVSPRQLSTVSVHEGNFEFIYKLLCKKQKSISVDKLNEIYALYKSLPAKSDSDRNQGLREGYLEITAEIVEELNSSIERTGLTIHTFMNLYGLNYIGIKNVQHWRSRYSKSAPKEHINTILNTWKTVPDNFYISIIPEMSEFVKSEIRRTGYGAYKILRGNKKAKENGINAAKINLVVNCSSSKMKATMLHQILALWKDISDKY
jgi:hypothetical protein